MNIQLAGTHQIDQIWPAVKAQVALAIERGNADDISLADVYANLRSGHWFLFVADDLSASLVLRFQHTTRGEVARIVAFTSTKSEDWAFWIKEIQRFAKSNGTNKIIFDGREGWKGKLPVKVLRCVYEMEF